MIYKYQSGMGSNPATVNIETGEVYVNKDIWDEFTPTEKAIILLHEEGHYANHTLDEIKADCYLIEKYLCKANNPKRRADLLNCIFKIVPDDERKIEFVRNLMQYDSTANNNRCSERLYKALSERKTANADGGASSDTGGENTSSSSSDTDGENNKKLGVTEIIMIGETALNLISIGVDFWQRWKNRETYWRGYDNDKKGEIIAAAAVAAIDAKYLATGNDYGAVLAAAQLPASDKKSLWCDTFSIIAQGVKFDTADFDNKQGLTVAQYSAIFWSKQGYQSHWMSDWVKNRREPMQQVWDNMSFWAKVKASNKYKLYVAAFLVAAFLIWKFA